MHATLSSGSPYKNKKSCYRLLQKPPSLEYFFICIRTSLSSLLFKISLASGSLPLAMASTTASMSTHNPRNCLIVNSFRNSPTKPSSVPTTFRQSEPSNKLDLSLSLVKTAAVAGVVISNLATSPLAMAAKQIAESPQEDNRGLALLIPVVPAVGWVLYNILGPALGQLNRMRSEKGIIVGLGLGGLAAAENALYVSTASAASEVVESEGASGGSNLLPLIVAAAVAFEVILFSTMQSKYEEKKSD